MLIMSDCQETIEQARASLMSWHRSAAALDTVFMYHNAAYAPLNLAESSRRAWMEMVKLTGVRLLVCRTAIERRGLANTPSPFVLGGLADWVQASLRSDVRRCVSGW